MRRFIGLFKDARGATAVEFAIILAMIFLAIVTAVAAVGTSTVGVWNSIDQGWRNA